jgi:two-component system sensor histidine kinase BaeS
VDLDPDRLTQILGNLINNALQVLSPGGILKIRASTEGKQFVLQVIDDGPGISKTDLPQIFNRSFRADRSRSGNGSSGLGLSIAQKLVEAQGGAIEVESALGEGTTFTVRFPAG